MECANNTDRKTDRNEERERERERKMVVAMIISSQNVLFFFKMIDILYAALHCVDTVCVVL